MLIVVLLLPVGRQPAAQPTPAAAVPLPLEAQVASDPLDLAIALDVDAQKWDRSRQPESPKVAPPEPVNLDVVASVCTELARVVDTRSLPSILERTAAALDATGIILWIADPDGRELTPIVAHGYSPQLLTRLGTIARDAQNATAAAFRTGLVQTVNADAGRCGRCDGGRSEERRGETAGEAGGRHDRRRSTRDTRRAAHRPCPAEGRSGRRLRDVR
jgi:hypothetical protein